MGKELLVKPKRRSIKYGEALLDMKAKFEKDLAEGTLKSLPPADPDEEHPAWGKLTVRQAAFISCYLDPRKAAGDVALASRYAGVSTELGKAWLRQSNVRARISAAVGASIVKPEAIMAELMGILSDPEQNANARVRAGEVLSKNLGMSVDRSISATIDLTDKKQIDDLLKNELRRVGVRLEDVAVDAEVVSTDQPVKSETPALPANIENYPRCLPLIHKPTGEKKIKHGALRIATDGVYCEKCGTPIPDADPDGYRIRIQGEGYKLKEGVWVRPKTKFD